MNKKEVAEIIKNGTVKAKINLLAEHVARTSNGDLKGLLTLEEYEQLLYAPKTGQRVQNLFFNNSRIMMYAIQALQTSYYSAAKSLSDLRGYVILWESIQVAQTMINLALEEIPAENQRLKVANKIATKAGNFLLTRNEVFEDGLFGVSVDQNDGSNDSFNLMKAINNVRSEVINQITVFKTYSSVVKNWMNETGFKPKTYVDKIKKWEDEILGDQAIWEKYSYEDDIPDSEKKQPLSIYRVYPDPSKIAILPELYLEIQTKLGISLHE